MEERYTVELHKLGFAVIDTETGERVMAEGTRGGEWGGFYWGRDRAENHAASLNRDDTINPPARVPA